MRPVERVTAQRCRPGRPGSRRRVPSVPRAVAAPRPPPAGAWLSSCSPATATGSTRSCRRRTSRRSLRCTASGAMPRLSQQRRPVHPLEPCLGDSAFVGIPCVPGELIRRRAVPDVRPRRAGRRSSRPLRTGQVWRPVKAGLALHPPMAPVSPSEVARTQATTEPSEPETGIGSAMVVIRERHAARSKRSPHRVARSTHCLACQSSP